MESFLKNQKYLTITIFSVLLIVSLSWYFFIHKSLKSEHKKSKQIKNSLNSEVSRYKNMQSQIRTMQDDWETLNNEFQTVIERIPDKRLYESVTDYLYSLIINHGLKIQNYSPSNAAIDKKNIFIAETGEELLIEKIPVDITVKGSFISFGQLLESMLTSQYRLTASNIEVAQKDLATSQIIKFISYTYFQTIKNDSRLIKKKSFTKNNLSTEKKVAPIKKIEATKAIDETVQVRSDDLEGVPEMWLEPATEPIDDSVPIEEPVTLKTPVPKKVEPVKKTKPIKEKKQKKETTPLQKNKYEDFHSIIVLESKMCQKVKNNQPINPGTQFPQDIGKIFCHSLLDNNSGKHRDIYHIWYLNGDLKAKVRIRVRSGKEIPAISHREFGNSDKGRWRIEITDGDKKILDTIIFELV